MQSTVTLTAEAAYGHGGNQYIARITGRDTKFTFAREFVGTKGGKRRESAEYQTDEPGLYVTCDIDKGGDKDETYHLVYEEPGHGIDYIILNREKAMLLAKQMDDGTVDLRREALTIRLAFQQRDLAVSGDCELMIRTAVGQYAVGTKIARLQLIAELERLLAPDLTGDEPKAAAVAEVKALMRSLGVTLADLSE